MGYDMTWENRNGCDVEAYEAARERFYEAARVRDSSGRGTGAADEAFRQMAAAEKWCFRLNMFGMSRYVGFMFEHGMVYEAQQPRWPTSDGLTDEDWATEDTGHETEPMRRYQSAAEKVRKAHGDQPGIPSFKFGSNDDWHVLALECSSAVEIWEAAGSPILDGGDGGAYWREWIQYLRGAAEHDGFRVR
jgi:hypothetical protein